MVEDAGGGDDVEESVDREIIEGSFLNLRGVDGTERAAAVDEEIDCAAAVVEEIVEVLDRSWLFKAGAMEPEWDVREECDRCERVTAVGETLVAVVDRSRFLGGRTLEPERRARERD